MKPQEIIKFLKTLPKDKHVMLKNDMGCPAYDYEGQRFHVGICKASKTLTITKEEDVDP